MHLNTRSFNKNGAALLLFLETFKTRFDNSTNLELATPAMENQIFALGMMSFINSTRRQGKGEGIAVLIKDRLL